MARSLTRPSRCAKIRRSTGVATAGDHLLLLQGVAEMIPTAASNKGFFNPRVAGARGRPSYPISFFSIQLSPGPMSLADVLHPTHRANNPSDIIRDRNHPQLCTVAVGCSAKLLYDLSQF